MITKSYWLYKTNKK